MSIDLCRLCLSQSAELFSIWNIMYDGVQASVVIKDIFDIKLLANDDYCSMCPTCKHALGEFYKFYNIVKKSNWTLSKKIKQGNGRTFDDSDNKSDLENIVRTLEDHGVDVNEDNIIQIGDPINTVSTQNNRTTINLASLASNPLIQNDKKLKTIGINPQSSEIEVKLNPVQTIDVNNLPNKIVVQKVANNFKLINNTGNKKITKIILAKNIPPHILQQKDALQRIVNKALAQKTLTTVKTEPETIKDPIDTMDDDNDVDNRLPTPIVSNDESDDDEALSKTKSRLIKKEKVKKKKTVKKERKMLRKYIKTEDGRKTRLVSMKVRKPRAQSERSKEQLARILAQIEEEKRAKEAMRLSKTEYIVGPGGSVDADSKVTLAEESDSEDFTEKDKKLTQSEVDQVYKDGKLVAQGADLEMLYRRIFGLQCEICDGKFKVLSDLLFHYKDVHKGMGFVRCCKRKFYTRYSVNRHLVKHIRPRSVECPICKKVISRKKSLGVHMQVHLPMDQRRYQCGMCKLGFTHMAQLQHHVARRHSNLTNADLYQCDICLKKFTTKPVHDYHKKSVHKEATDLCQECGKTFKTVASLNAHIKRLHTEGGDPKMKCPHCTSICKKSNLKIHIKTVHENIRKPCPQCGEMVYPKSMKSHIRHRHDEGLMYPCSFCGKRFKCEKYLKFHIVQHTGVPNYACEYCPKTFASSGNYHTHRKRVHKKELEKLAQQKILNSNLVPVYNPDEDKRINRNMIPCDPSLLENIRYKNPTIFIQQKDQQQQQEEPQHQQQQTHIQQHHQQPQQQHQQESHIIQHHHTLNPMNINVMNPF